MNKVVGSWWDKEEFGAAWSIMTTSSRVGAVLGGLTASFLLRVSGWRTLLRTASGFIAITSVGMMLFLRNGPLGQDKTDQSAVTVGPSYTTGLRKICLHPRVLLAYGTQGCVLPLNELNSLLPLFLVQNVNISLSFASSMATVYPLGAIVSMILSGKVYDRLAKSASPDRNRRSMFLCQNTLALLCLQVLSVLPSNPVLVMGCLFGTMAGVSTAIYTAMHRRRKFRSVGIGPEKHLCVCVHRCTNGSVWHNVMSMRTAAKQV
jgi:MFS family permease